MAFSYTKIDTFRQMGFLNAFDELESDRKNLTLAHALTVQTRCHQILSPNISKWLRKRRVTSKAVLGQPSSLQSALNLALRSPAEH